MQIWQTYENQLLLKNNPNNWNTWKPSLKHKIETQINIYIKQKVNVYLSGTTVFKNITNDRR
jgi:hypothetical protein